MAQAVYASYHEPSVSVRYFSACSLIELYRCEAFLWQFSRPVSTVQLPSAQYRLRNDWYLFYSTSNAWTMPPCVPNDRVSSSSSFAPSPSHTKSLSNT